MNQEAGLAIAFFEQASSKLLGEPPSLGTKLIINSILGNQPAKYSYVKTESAFHLGVLGCFANMALLAADHKIMFRLILSDSRKLDSYMKDLYGPNKISIQEYLSAFGIEIVPNSALNGSREFKTYIRNAPDKILVISTRDTNFLINANYEEFKDRELYSIKNNKLGVNI